MVTNHIGKSIAVSYYFQRNLRIFSQKSLFWGTPNCSWLWIKAPKILILGLARRSKRSTPFDRGETGLPSVTLPNLELTSSPDKVWRALFKKLRVIFFRPPNFIDALHFQYVHRYENWKNVFVTTPGDDSDPAPINSSRAVTMLHWTKVLLFDMFSDLLSWTNWP